MLKKIILKGINVKSKNKNCNDFDCGSVGNGWEMEELLLQLSRQG